MFLRWPNGAFFVGPLMEQDAWGIRLTYGNRELLGETVPVGERYFVYDHAWCFAQGLDLRVAGSLARGIRRRLGIKVYRWMTRHEHLAPLQVLEVQASQEAFCLCPDRQEKVEEGQGREERFNCCL